MLRKLSTLLAFLLSTSASADIPFVGNYELTQCKDVSSSDLYRAPSTPATFMIKWDANMNLKMILTSESSDGWLFGFNFEDLNKGQVITKFKTHEVYVPECMKDVHTTLADERTLQTDDVLYRGQDFVTDCDTNVYRRAFTDRVRLTVSGSKPNALTLYRYRLWPDGKSTTEYTCKVRRAE